MTLTLRIENFDSLQDGGPTSATVSGKGMPVGRSTAMDWSLPDPHRHISSHHFDITYRDNAYWLTDVSTNGVFLDGQRHRIEGAHQIRSGDRFQVGHYFIGAVLGNERAATAQPARTPPPAFDDSDPWAVSSAPVTPIDPNPRPNPSAFEDFSSEFIVNPVPPAPQPAPEQPSSAPIPAAPSPFGNSASPFSQPAPIATPAPQLPTAAPDNSAAIIAAFCEGAGIAPPPPGTPVDATAFARELGKTMQGVAVNLMAMLENRAAAKKFTRGGDRTMRRATDNNPLKFLPDPAQALEVMFTQPRPGFMPGSEAVTAALGDVKLHQMAVFAAIQPALIKLLADLSPEAIEEATGGGLLAGGRRKSWDEFVKRWDAKVANHENGMLDVFLAHFAESYAAAVAAARR